MATEDIVEMQSLYRELLQEKRKLKAEIERLREDLLEVNTELGIYQEIYGDYDAELNNTGGE